MADQNERNVFPNPGRFRDERYRDYYANNVNMRMGPFDLALVFSKLTEVAPGVVGALDVCEITISPQQFKAMALAMSEVLMAYEKVFGVLSINTEDTKPILNADQIASTAEIARTISRNAKNAIVEENSRNTDAPNSQVVVDSSEKIVKKSRGRTR